MFELIHFHGLNCYQDCVLSIANNFGLDYSIAFSTLWSETDFRYDPYRKFYLTKRLITNLGIMGAQAVSYDCFSPEDTDKNLARFSEGEYMIIGMDSFYIPWSQFYQIFHGPHYFIAKNEKKDKLVCYDPTFKKENEQIAYSDIVAHIFDVVQVSKTEKTTFVTNYTDEAHEVIRNHTATRQTLLAEINDCVNKEKEEIILLAKYIDALICNRYLHLFFIKNKLHNESHLFFNKEFFLKWNAVKNGVYKLSIDKNKTDIINDICSHVNYILDEEITFAQKIINGILVF